MPALNVAEEQHWCSRYEHVAEAIDEPLRENQSYFRRKPSTNQAILKWIKATRSKLYDGILCTVNFEPTFPSAYPNFLLVNFARLW